MSVFGEVIVLPDEGIHFQLVGPIFDLTLVKTDLYSAPVFMVA